MFPSSHRLPRWTATDEALTTAQAHEGPQTPGLASARQKQPEDTTPDPGWREGSAVDPPPPSWGPPRGNCARSNLGATHSFSKMFYKKPRTQFLDIINYRNTIHKLRQTFKLELTVKYLMPHQSQSRSSKVSGPGNTGQSPNTVVFPISGSFPLSVSCRKPSGRPCSRGPARCRPPEGLQVPLKGNSTDLKSVPESKKSRAGALW